MFEVLTEPDLNQMPSSFTGIVHRFARTLGWQSWLSGKIISLHSTQLEASTDLAAELPPRIHYH